MKRTLYFIGAAVAALSTVSCAKEILSAEEAGKNEEQIFGETVFTLGADIDNSKVTLDGINLSWSVGDQIVVNGVTSKPLATITESGGANFEFDQVLDPPFYAVYPASAYVDGSFSTDGDTPATNIDFPAKHSYVEGGIDPASALMIGSAAEDGNILFSHSATYLKLTFDKDVKSVRVMANNGMRVAGYLKVDYGTNATSNYYSTSNFNTITLTGNISAGSPVIIALPAKNYTTGLNIFAVTADDQYQVLKTTAFDATDKRGALLAKSASLNNLRPWYGPGIYNEEDWKSFVCADESKYSTDLTQQGDASDWKGDDGEFNIWEDFTVEGNITRHGSNVANAAPKETNMYFTGTLDGNRHTITQTKSTAPMISFIGSAEEEGTVKNLTLAGECKSLTQPGWGSASFAIRLLAKGKISNCTNTMNTHIEETSPTSTSVLLSGFVTSNQGRIEDCINNGNIEYNAYYKATRKVYIGGFCAQNWTSNFGDQGYGDFIRCTNNGAFKMTKKSDSAISSQYTVLGGICGGVMGGEPGAAYTSSYSSFDLCENTGDITFWEDGNNTDFSVICGGIIGASTPYSSNCPYVGGTSGYYFIIRSGKNTGNFDVSSSCTSVITATKSGARQVYVGGLVGFALGSPALNDAGTAAASSKYAIIRGGSNCTMKLGSIKGNECAGGIVGGGGFLSMEYIVNSSLKIEKTANTMFEPVKIGAVGALIGLNVKRSLVSGNNNSPLLKVDASASELPISFLGLSGNTGATSNAADGITTSTGKKPYLIYEKSSSGTNSYIIRFAGKKKDGSTFTPVKLTGTTSSGVECFYGSGNTLVRDAGRVTVVDYTE